jgi:hypothetical protein
MVDNRRTGCYAARGADTAQALAQSGPVAAYLLWTIASLAAFAPWQSVAMAGAFTQGKPPTIRPKRDKCHESNAV